LATVLAATVLAAWPLGNLAAPQIRQQPPTFRAAVDLIAVDVQVVGSDGLPMTALAGDQFEVTIDGRRRRVVSADFVQQSASSGRTFVLAVDTASFDPGQALAIVQAVRGFVGRLSETDRVGLLTLSAGGPRLDPTLERAALWHALDRVAGQRQSLPGQFNLSVSEIIDITAETGSLGSPLSTAAQGSTGVRGAAMPVTTVTDTLQRVQVRECRQTTDLGCVESIVSEASALAQHLEDRVTQSLNGLSALLDALRGEPGRKTVVLLSGGMAVSDRPGGRVNVGDEARLLGEQAAHANATIYALHVDLGLMQSYAPQSRRARDSVSLERERRLSSRLLEEFAVASGGTVLPVVVGNGEIALDRVLRETSAYYLLGVEPAQLDRDGRAHRLSVKVNQRGATVRSRQWVVLRAATH
jgi:VWFA-related protein